MTVMKRVTFFLSISRGCFISVANYGITDFGLESESEKPRGISPF